MTANAKIVPPQGGRELRIRNERLWIKLRSEDTGGAFAVLESVTPPGGGPSLHCHSREDEAFYVLEGLYEFQVGTEIVQASAGTVVHGIRGIPHAFSNIGKTDARVLVFVRPAGLERLFEETSELLAAGPHNPAQMAELSVRYGIEELA